MPTPTPTFFCNGTWCYQYASSTMPYNASQAFCANRGGALVRPSAAKSLALPRPTAYGSLAIHAAASLETMAAGAYPNAPLARAGDLLQL